MSKMTFAEQRLALTLLMNDPTWLGSPDGDRFVAALHSEIAGYLCSIAREMDYPMDRDEAVQLVLVNLLDAPKVCMAIVQATKPFAYLATSAKKWVRAEIGQRGSRFDLVGDIADDRPVFQEMRDDQDAADAEFIENLTRTTMAHLAVCLPEAMRGRVAALVTWLATEPPTRHSYEHEVLKEAPATLGLTMEQITATANICWGGRPHQAETSLFAAIITNPDLTAAGYTLTQTKALALFNDRMTRSIPATLEGVAA